MIGLIQLCKLLDLGPLLHCMIVNNRWQWFVQSNPGKWYRINVYKGCWTARDKTITDSLTYCLSLLENLIRINKKMFHIEPTPISLKVISYKIRKYVIEDSLATGSSLPFPVFSKRGWLEVYIHNDEIPYLWFLLTWAV